MIPAEVVVVGTVIVVVGTVVGGTVVGGTVVGGTVVVVTVVGGTVVGVTVVVGVFHENIKQLIGCICTKTKLNVVYILIKWDALHR